MNPEDIFRQMSGGFGNRNIHNQKQPWWDESSYPELSYEPDQYNSKGAKEYRERINTFLSELQQKLHSYKDGPFRMEIQQTGNNNVRIFIEDSIHFYDLSCDGVVANWSRGVVR